jgi:competence protein ComEC
LKTPDRTLGHRAPLLWLAIPFATGLSASGFAAGVRPVWLLAAALAAALAATAASRADRGWWGAAVASSMALAGTASGILHRPAPADLPRRLLRQARLEVRLDRVWPPAAGAKRTSAEGTIVGADPPRRTLVGRRLYLSAADGPGPAPIRSEVVLVQGTVSAVPPGADPGSFAGYLDGLGLDLRMLRGRVLGQVRPPSSYRRFCEELASRMNAILGLGLESRPDLAAAYRAMMLGRRRDLRPADKQRFLRAGAMHLFAINGVHIGVVAVALDAFLALLRFPPAAAAAATLAVLWLDVDSTGESPSAVRAFLMVAAVASARILRRPVNPLAALSAAALAILLVEPTDLFGASFQMSYGVVAALVLLGLPLGARLRRRLPPFPALPRAFWDRPIPPGSGWPLRRRVFHLSRRAAGRLQEHLFDALGPGIAAALSAALCGIGFFRLLAPVGLLSNLVLVPPAGLAITAGFFSLGFGLAGALPASRLLNRSAGVLLWLISGAMRILNRIPGGSLPAHFRAPWIGPASLVLFLAACMAGYAGGWRGRRGGFWPPFAVVALALALGVSYTP